jgi:G3E family GTPase
LNTGRFDFDTAHEHPLWAKELYGFAEHIPETEEYGISHFVYRARRPFHPQKIHDALNADLPGVIRAKGHFWVATRPNWVAEFSLAGALSGVTPLGTWWAAVPRDRWPDTQSARDYAAQHWMDPWGDRRQELVFIGSGMDEAAIRASLDACLMGDDQRGIAPDWADLPDPFPVWRRAAAA